MSRVRAFMSVGAIGFVLQVGVLGLLTIGAGWPYQVATAIAVELAVIQNFLWHERWTWRDRVGSHRGLLARFLRYQITTGATSMAGNFLCTSVLVEQAGVPVLAANVAAVGMMAVANFMVSDRWVFTHGAMAAAAALIAMSASPASAAELRPDVIEAWNTYVAEVEARFNQARTTASTAEAVEGEAIGIAGGTIHHWRGSTVIRGISVETLVRTLMDRGTPPPQDDVLEARVLERSTDSLRVYLKLVRRTIMTVAYDTEHRMTFWRESPGLAKSRSVSTRISEAGGSERGFLWRLNSYWRYVQVGPDVRVDLESVSLSRDIPRVLKPVAGPLVGRIGRESMTRTLDAMRDYFEHT
jgi:putative flippase GtrA